MRVALLTVSGSGSEGQTDLSGHLLHKLLVEGGVRVVRAETLDNDREAISAWLCRAADELKVDVAVTSGGTGLGIIDVTPEATRDAIDFEVPGIAEAIRAAGLAKTPLAMLWRGVAGVRRQTLVVNLSGSPKLVTEQWSIIEPVVEAALTSVRRSEDQLEGGRQTPRMKAAPGKIDVSGTLVGPSNFIYRDEE